MEKLSFLIKVTIKDIKFQVADIFGREDDTFKFDISDISNCKEDYFTLSNAIDELGINQDDKISEVVLSNGEKVTLKSD